VARLRVPTHGRGVPRRPLPDDRNLPLLDPDGPSVPDSTSMEPHLVVADADADAALLSASNTLADRRRADTADPWEHSPFRWIRTMPAPSRAKVAVDIVDLVLRGAGFVVVPRTGPGHDRVVQSTRVQVRFSTLWSAGWYTFQKIKASPGYDAMVLLGLSPRGAHAWVVDQDTAVALAAAGTEAGWLTVNPASPPPLLAHAGGSPARFLSASAAHFGAPTGPPHGPARLEL
jgi:hypothetical protein